MKNIPISRSKLKRPQHFSLVFANKKMFFEEAIIKIRDSILTLFFISKLIFKKVLHRDYFYLNILMSFELNCFIFRLSFLIYTKIQIKNFEKSAKFTQQKPAPYVLQFCYTILQFSLRNK